MINIALYSDGVFESCGVPNYFLFDADLKALLQDDAFRDAFIAKFGEGVCVGTLGKRTPAGFVEDTDFELPEEDLRKGDLSFYEKL